MEELKVLIGMVNDLPALAIWVLVGFFAYKVVIVGSIYGLIRLVVVKAHEAYTKERVVKFKVGSKVISEDVAARLVAQLDRLGGLYIHNSHVDDLSKALDIVLEKKGGK